MKVKRLGVCMGVYLFLLHQKYMNILKNSLGILFGVKAWVRKKKKKKQKKKKKKIENNCVYYEGQTIGCMYGSLSIFVAPKIYEHFKKQFGDPFWCKSMGAKKKKKKIKKKKKKN
eukprot:TRINITY_DN77857_c0_g1_i1.p4 TRINITY_DN77857_c0_g1~~TRINITY_DN77857_c0_g1_i1.p4  ORF type:complete len:115 (+),score=22.81 TRINITY_DN77857_c0_g1_i1:330-674(+)